MAISNKTLATINSAFADQGVVADMQQAALSGAQLASPARLVTAAGPISASDYRVILNGASGAKALALPPGQNGMTINMAKAGGDAATWSLVPAGSDVLDSGLSGATGIGSAAGSSFAAHHVNGTWYKI